MKEETKQHYHSKSKNPKVIDLYDYVLTNSKRDSDYWSMGGGNYDVLAKLKELSPGDWLDFNEDFPNWNFDHRGVVLEVLSDETDSIEFYQNNPEFIKASGRLFMHVYNVTSDCSYEISLFIYTILLSKASHDEFLNEMKHWIIQKDFDLGADEDVLNPVTNIDKILNREYT